MAVIISTSRTSGIAPLSVFFDATGTTGLTDNGFFANSAAYMDATFAWNFDADGTDVGAKYRTASGFLVAHVFENPGTYRVTLDVYDAAGVKQSGEVTITVSAFSGTTYYVAANGSDSNTGAIDSPFLTPAYALSSSHLAPNVRVLFRRGDTFNISSAVSISNETGPIIIGSYSDGATALPIIHTTAVNSDWTTISLSGSTDIRIMDIAVTGLGQSSENPRYPYGIVWDNSCTHMLKYRTEEYHNGGIALSPNGQYTTIAECIFHDTTQTGYTTNEGGTNDGNALIGNNVYDKNTTDTNNEEHVFRLQGGSRYFIAHNTFGPNIIVNYDALTIRGNSDRVVIYKNRLQGYIQAFWPQNRNSASEYQHHCIMDSNLIMGQGLYGGDRETAIAVSAKDIVIRNNIIYNYQYGIMLNNDSVVGASERIKVYNNTFINLTGNDTFYALNISSACSNIVIYNNLMLGASGSSQRFIDLRDGTTFSGISNYNMLYYTSWTNNTILFDSYSLTNWRTNYSNDANTSISDPTLASTDTNNINFAKPLGGSPVIGAGTFTPAALDYYGTLRGSVIDIGAVEYAQASKQFMIRRNA